MKILVLQLKRIGDLILTTPALVALRSLLPEAEITLVVEQATQELLPAMDFIDAALVYQRRGGNGVLWRKMLFSHYDLCLDFTGTDRSASFSLLSKARRRITFSWVQKSRVRALFYNHFVESSVRENHTVDHYVHLVGALGFKDGAPPVTLHLPEWAEKKSRQLLTEAGVPENFVIVHPGSARPEKYWPPERWAEVIAFVTREWSVPCVLTGSREPFEQEHLAAIRRLTACPDFSGRMDLLTLAALTKNALLVLSVDSASMHLAGAFGTPQVALFGPTNPFHWRPRHPRATILHAGSGVPTPAFKPHQQGAAMSELSTERVISAINSALGHVEKS